MATDTSELFAAFNCERAEYEIKISLDKFEFEQFKKAFYESIRVPFSENKNSNGAVGATRDSDYHVHFDWQLSEKKNSFRTRLAYVKGESEPDVGDGGPYAENFMNWLGAFFKYEKAEAHVHVGFRYSKAKYQCLLPIPMTIPTEAKGIPSVEVFGMAVNLPSELKGIHQAYVTALESSIVMEITGFRNITFTKFNLKSELAEISSVSKMLARENK